MGNLLIINILSNYVAAIYNKMRTLILKLHETSSSVRFIKKSLFAKLKGQIINNNTRTTKDKEIMKKSSYHLL